MQFGAFGPSEALRMELKPHRIGVTAVVGDGGAASAVVNEDPGGPEP
jgi:hypothetical protein